MQIKSRMVLVSLVVLLKGSAIVAAPLDTTQALFRSLNGVSLSTQSSQYKSITEKIAQGKWLEAARVATNTPSFYLNVVKPFAAQMSVLDERQNAPFNDFQAMVIGAVKDGLDARTLLTGDFTYVPKKGTYQDVENASIDYRAQIQKQSPQRKNFPDAAGLLTTDAWGAAHLIDGTNRRAIKFAFREFLCSDITEWKDVNQPDTRIRRDITRAPGGNPGQFQSDCRGCHAPMDGMGGAYARFDFSNGQLRYLIDDVAAKMNQKSSEYPEGYYTFDDSWMNYATDTVAFGWKGNLRGNGIKQFGEMISNSDKFKSCMTKRAVAQTCGEMSQVESQPWFKKLADQFEVDHFDLKQLFERVAVEPACLDNAMKRENGK